MWTLNDLKKRLIPGKYKKICYIVILLILLFFTRFIDFSILSYFGNREYSYIRQCPNFLSNFDKTNYYSIGLSSYENAKRKLFEMSKGVENKIIILHFYDLLHPSRYLILNRGDKEFIDLPWTWYGLRKEERLLVENGITEINLFKFDYISIVNKGQRKGEIIIIIGSFISYMADYWQLERESRNDDRQEFKIMLVEDTFDYFLYSIYMKRIYFFYFFFPLVLILTLSRRYNIQLAFSYFVIMSLITAPSLFAFYAPSLGLLDYESEISTPLKLLSIIVSILYGIFFIKNIRHGFRSLKEKKLNRKEKFIILYFLLLPLFLRF